MLPREAARVLECSEETVKNRIRSGRLEGRHFTNDRGENRYYAEAEAVREAARERQSWRASGTWPKRGRWSGRTPATWRG
jgi:transposase